MPKPTEQEARAHQIEVACRRAYHYDAKFQARVKAIDEAAARLGITDPLHLVIFALDLDDHTRREMLDSA